MKSVGNPAADAANLSRLNTLSTAAQRVARYLAQTHLRFDAATTKQALLMANASAQTSVDDLRHACTTASAVQHAQHLQRAFRSLRELGAELATPSSVLGVADEADVIDRLCDAAAAAMLLPPLPAQVYAVAQLAQRCERIAVRYALSVIGERGKARGQLMQAIEAFDATNRSLLGSNVALPLRRATLQLERPWADLQRAVAEPPNRQAYERVGALCDLMILELGGLLALWQLHSEKTFS